MHEYHFALVERTVKDRVSNYRKFDVQDALGIAYLLLFVFYKLILWMSWGDQDRCIVIFESRLSVSSIQISVIKQKIFLFFLIFLFDRVMVIN